MTHDLSDIVPITFELSPARAGWIGMTIRAGEAEARASCSDVYDPFPDLVRMMQQVVGGLPAAVDIDQEGWNKHIWLTRAPGSFVGRLRVFVPNENGEPEPLEIDATVDALQFCKAFRDVFVPYAASYDHQQWHLNCDEKYDTPLSKIDMRYLDSALGAFGLAPGRNAHKWSRDRYEAALRDKAVPMLPGTLFEKRP